MSGRLQEPATEAPGPEAGSERHFEFYDELRERVQEWVRRRSGGRVSEETLEMVLAAPDLFMLLLRLAADPRVPRASRTLFATALAYFVLPVDLFPEAVLGAGGFVDDVVLAASVLMHALGRDLEPLAEQAWSGTGAMRDRLRWILERAGRVLGPRLSRRVERFLEKRGVGGAQPPPS